MTLDSLEWGLRKQTPKHSTNKQTNLSFLCFLYYLKLAITMLLSTIASKNSQVRIRNWSLGCPKTQCLFLRSTNTMSPEIVILTSQKHFFSKIHQWLDIWSFVILGQSFFIEKNHKIPFKLFHPSQGSPICEKHYKSFVGHFSGGKNCDK